MIRNLILLTNLSLLTTGCVYQGLYQERDGEWVSSPDWKISKTELNAVRDEITTDLTKTGFAHGIPPLWHLRVRPVLAYRNEFIYVLPLLSYHSSNLTIGNIACFRLTDAPISHDQVSGWPWSGDTNLFVIWQNRYAYFATYNDKEIKVYKDYIGSLFWLPITRIFSSPREIATIKRVQE